ncbi:MAG: TldD/PmbA family protein [Candidatus Aenigmatarchaeota archaeon]
MNLISFATKNGADDVAIETIRREASQIKFSNSSVNVGQNWLVTRHNVFVSVKNATASSTFQGLTEQQLSAAIKSLIFAAKKSNPSTEYSGLANGPFKYKAVNGVYDKNVVDYDSAHVVEIALDASAENSKTAAGFFYKEVSERNVQTSSGADAAEKKTELQLSIRAFNEQNESGHAVSCSRMLKGFDPEGAGSRAGETAKLAKNPVSGKPGKYDIIFAPMAIGNLLSRVGEFSTAFNIDSGFSCFGEKVGKQVASNIVNINDNGRLQNGFNSSHFDDEGVPTKITSIIRNGVLKTYLHNTSSARKHKTKTTANAGIISQRYNNLILEPGKVSKEKLFAGVDNGLFVTNVWYTRFQSYYAGDFSTIPRDGIFVIKNGVIAGSVNNVRITENIMRMLLNISGLSNRTECVQWWEEISPPVYTPYALIKDVNVTLPTM